MEKRRISGEKSIAVMGVPTPLFSTSHRTKPMITAMCRPGTPARPVGRPESVPNDIVKQRSSKTWRYGACGAGR